jgi:hypothetical protein
LETYAQKIYWKHTRKSRASSAMSNQTASHLPEQSAIKPATIGHQPRRQPATGLAAIVASAAQAQSAAARYYRQHRRRKDDPLPNNRQTDGNRLTKQRGISAAQTS